MYEVFLRRYGWTNGHLQMHFDDSFQRACDQLAFTSPSNRFVDDDEEDGEYIPNSLIIDVDNPNAKDEYMVEDDDYSQDGALPTGWNTNRIRGLRARPDGRARGSCHGCAASSPADASDRTSGGARRPPVYTKVHISWTGSVDRHDFVWDRCPRPSPVVGPVQASPWAGTGRRGGPVAAGGVGGQGLAARR